MELTTIQTLFESLGIPAAILILGFFCAFKFSAFLKSEYVKNDTERKENTANFMTTIIENNTKLMDLQKDTNLILTNSTQALDNNSVAFLKLSDKLNFKCLAK